MIGYLFVLTSTILYGLMPVLFKKASQQTPAFSVMTVSMLALFLSSLILSFFFEKGALLKVMENRNLILLLIGVGLINTLGFWLAIQGYKYMPLWQQTLFSLTVPVSAGIFAYFILGETISIKLFLG